VAELKACPFCRGELIIKPEYLAHPDRDCVLAGFGWSHEKVSAWNTRAPDPAPGDETAWKTETRAAWHARDEMHQELATARAECSELSKQLKACREAKSLA
jgi:hypothetical protein